MLQFRVNTCVFHSHHWRWTNLFTVLLEEAGRIHAICNSASNEGDVVKDHGRLIGVREEKLVGNVEDDGQGDEGTQQNRDLRPQSQSLELESERVAREFLKNAHIEGRGSRTKDVEKSV